jgi:ABC-type dipeptide/oligopeptide/nickel transport system permease component
MYKFILKRVGMLFPTLFGVITLVFFMLALSPGEPARVILGESANKEAVEKLNAELGLAKPMHVQYVIYLKKVVQLDFGRSIKTGQRVIDEIKSRFPATIELAIFSMILASVAGIFIGVISATKRYSLLDYVSMFGALFGVSMPVFWLGLVLIIIFSVNLNLLPTGGRMDIRYYFVPITNFYILDGLIHFFKSGDLGVFLSAVTHMILPAVTLGTIPLAIIARITRSSMLEVLKQDYIKTARAIGTPEHKVIFKYALRNALLPVITVIGLQFGMLLAGAILTETIFAWPGIGKWLYHAIESRDFPAIQGGIIVISTCFVLINLFVDLLYSVINPKIRTE